LAGANLQPGEPLGMTCRRGRVTCDGDDGARHFQSKGLCMSLLISALITFLVVILVLYLVNMLPIDGRAKQIVRVIVIIIGVISLLRYLAVF
jgi:hypothetical protein